MTRLALITNLLLVLLLSLLFAWNVALVLVHNNVDFKVYIQWAQDMRAGLGGIPVNPLFELLILGLAFFLPISTNIPTAAYLVSVFFHVLTGYLIYRLYLYPVLGEAKNRDDVFLAIFMSIGLVLAAAISLFTVTSHNLYMGYVQPVLYHNANYIMLRVFALLLFLRLAQSFTSAEKASLISILFTAALVILSALARPHLLLVLIPSFGLYAAWQILRRQVCDWRHLVLGLALPGLAILVLQAVIWPNLQNVGEGGGFAIIPFALATYTANGAPLLPKYFLSILFPLAVYLRYWQISRHELSLNLAWLGFFLSNIFTYFFVEANRIEHFNFIATSQIALFLLMVISMQFFLRQIKQNGTYLLGKWETLLLLIFALHLISGVLWLYTQTVFEGMLWW